ncbi:AAA family ATPase [Mucilaginibacter sp. FT3.2]|uniref:AAA family ATPase n=1 Tax=Mucilaginibacter sp. FT3.2 TaxID=2723090 RepID=UPI001611D4BA|nr:ATP-binding protein [Mucilaginibacter sp. FT3.2]MBB6235080.1 AAA15 family ATPase/GTPase [Mucilaginibacter sp. FT3.2]
MPTETAEERPRVYLNSVHLKGFKSIEDLTIDLKKGLNILIGKNGSGKSNFMDFIYQAIRIKSNLKASYKYSKLEFNADEQHSFSIEVERDFFTKSEQEYPSNRLKFSEKFFIDNKKVFDNSQGSTLTKDFEFQNRQIRYTNISMGLFYILGYQNIYSYYLKYSLPDNLACVDIPGTIKANTGDGFVFWSFPRVLNFMEEILSKVEIFFDEYTEDAEPKNKIENASSSDILGLLKIQDKTINNIKLYTNIEDLRFNGNINLYREDKSVIIENIKIDFKVNGNWLPWSQLSDGTKRLFYIISEITVTDGLILIEEPELGIHPHQFNLLMDFLKEQSEEKQIIISTHSPKALDHLSPEELDHILIAYYDLEKGTQIRHLSDKEISKAQKYMKEVGFFSDYWMLSDLE